MPSELIHELIPVGMLQCNCSILGDPQTHEAIVVDPGDEVDRILEVLRRHHLKVLAIVSTHTHIDHVGGLAALHRATGAPVLIHEHDMALYKSLDVQAQWLGVATPETTAIRDFVKEGDTLRWGNFAADVLHTPGHTQGSISLVVKPGYTGGQRQASAGASESQGLGLQHVHAEPSRARSLVDPGEGPGQRLISGDTLFLGSIGRTDLPGGSFPQIIQSIRSKLLTLPDDVIVYPGHGDTTTIGAERADNPFLR
jgi:hydroxyacylglutathione hydrolase